VHYDGSNYRLMQRRMIFNGGRTPQAKYEIKVSVARFLNDEASMNLEHHARHPLTRRDPVEDLALEAWYTNEAGRHQMAVAAVKIRNEEVNFDLLYPPGQALQPGQLATIEYCYQVSDQQWGQWYQRNIKANTERLSVEAHLPAALEPECWGMTLPPSETNWQPLAELQVTTDGDYTVYSSEHDADDDDLAERRRIRLDWFFWRRILETRDHAEAASILRQFGILQVRNAERGLKVSRTSLPTVTRPLSMDVPAERVLADRILAHLRKVAGWVNRYHAFKPGVSMGIAAPQLGMAYRIAIVSRPAATG
jgi:hypothetical protein